MKQKFYSKEHLIFLLQGWANKHGKTPNKRSINNDVSMPSDMPYRCMFGSWGNGLRAAGFVPTKFMPPGKTKGIRNKFRNRVVNVHGYVEVFEPNHPLARNNGYVSEHRMMAWDAGLLKSKELQVHHKNKIKTDNRIENFEILSCAEHSSIHWKGVKRKPFSKKHREIISFNMKNNWARKKLLGINEHQDLLK